MSSGSAQASLGPARFEIVHMHESELLRKQTKFKYFTRRCGIAVHTRVEEPSDVAQASPTADQLSPARKDSFRFLPTEESATVMQ